MQGKQMSTRIEEDECQLVLPLSGPSYGAYAKVKRSWRKPLCAIIADALLNSRAVLSRLDRGMYMLEDNSHYRDAFNELYRRTQEQIDALEAFAQVDWRE